MLIPSSTLSALIRNPKPVAKEPNYFCVIPRICFHNEVNDIHRSTARVALKQVAVRIVHQVVVASAMANRFVASVSAICS